MQQPVEFFNGLLGAAVNKCGAVSRYQRTVTHEWCGRFSEPFGIACHGLPCVLALARIFHQHLLRLRKSPRGLRYASARDPQRVRNMPPVAGLACLATERLAPPRYETDELCGLGART